MMSQKNKDQKEMEENVYNTTGKLRDDDKKSAIFGMMMKLRAGALT